MNMNMNGVFLFYSLRRTSLNDKLLPYVKRHQAVDTSIDKSETICDLACVIFTMIIKIVIEERRLIPILIQTIGSSTKNHVIETFVTFKTNNKPN